MARTEKITCDVCGTEKKKTNHWFTLRVVFEVNSAVREIVISKGLNFPQSAKDVRDYEICGETCLLRKISALIQD